MLLGNGKHVPPWMPWVTRQPLCPSSSSKQSHRVVASLQWPMVDTRRGSGGREGSEVHSHEQRKRPRAMVCDKDGKMETSQRSTCPSPTDAGIKKTLHI